MQRLLIDVQLPDIDEGLVAELGLEPTVDDRRRVLAVLAFLRR